MHGRCVSDDPSPDTDVVTWGSYVEGSLSSGESMRHGEGYGQSEGKG